MCTPTAVCRTHKGDKNETEMIKGGHLNQRKSSENDSSLRASYRHRLATFLEATHPRIRPSRKDSDITWRMKVKVGPTLLWNPIPIIIPSPAWYPTLLHKSGVQKASQKASWDMSIKCLALFLIERKRFYPALSSTKTRWKRWNRRGCLSSWFLVDRCVWASLCWFTFQMLMCCIYIDRTG